MIAIEFTDHATDNMGVRKLDRDLIIDIVRNPEQIVEQDNGRFVHQSRVTIRGRRYLVRAFVEYADDAWTVVSVYDTSKLNKYWSRS